MIDTETLGILPSAPVIQIGFIVFDEDFGQISGTEINVDIVPQIIKGAMPESEAMKFHRERDEMPRSKVMSPVDALSALNQAIEFYGVRTLWANSPSFDMILLRRMYRDHTHWVVPWSHKNERCLRTVVNLARLTGATEPRSVVPHTALADCEAQLATLRWAVGALGGPWLGGVGVG